MILRFAESVFHKLVVAGTDAKLGLGVEWFEPWSPRLDEALGTLPDSEICPHDLFRRLMTTVSVGKKTALVMADRKPFAVVGLRRPGVRWEMVTQWIIPEFLFPAREGTLWQGIIALGLDLPVACWRWTEPPPVFPWIRDIRSRPTFGQSCSRDFEAHWRRSSLLKNVRNCRERCRGFESKVDAPGMREWTVRNWGAKWASERPRFSSEVDDRLLITEDFERRQRAHTLSLHDRGEPIAGAVFLIHRGDAVAYVNYRDSRYDSYSLMTRLIDLSFSWARETGFEGIDLGGGHEYKSRWAPENGTRWECLVRPHFAVFGMRAGGFLERIGKRIKGRAEDRRSEDSEP